MTTIKRLRMAEAGKQKNWIYLFITLGIALCVTEARFTINQDVFNFDKALEACQPDGFLANMASLEEVSDILGVISDTLRHNPTYNSTREFHFRIGLKSGRDNCVVSGQPLRGFKWVENVITDIQNQNQVGVWQWREEPLETCTGTRCALLSGEFNGTDVVNWGLISSTCKSEYPIVCKEWEGGAQKGQCDPYESPNARSQDIKPDGTLMVECWNGDIHTLTCSAVTHKWKSDDLSAKNGDICPSCEEGSVRDKSGSCVDVDKCLPNPCKNVCISNNGSYTCYCFNQLGDIQEEGSPSCSGSTNTSVPPEGVTKPHANVTQVNTPTVDLSIPERPSPSSPPAPPGSPASPTDNSKVQTHSNVFIPVLIAVMGLVVLVVVVLVVVKCCLRSRSRKLAMKKSEQMAMKRAEASKQAGLNGQDSMEHTTEKEAT
ncbi:C-type lectin domain family 14 member A [Osmerus mordax]|uniref:C-type lectin domain family 14 member A n=1 Tax=Osmerus mordax TaxID=8014 RepID=UPI00350FDD09